MNQATSACVRPTKRFPDGRTGTAAGYQAHRTSGETPCEGCATAQAVKSAAYEQSLSQERSLPLEGQRPRRKPVGCSGPTPDHPNGRQGTDGGYMAHFEVGENPCKPCRESSAAPGAACARPTLKYPEGRTGIPAGYSAHRVAGENACDPCRLANNTTTQVRQAGRAEIQRRHYAANREMYAYRAIRLKYTLTMEQYDAILQEQGGGCAICGTTKPGNRSLFLNVDHDHACCPGGKSCGKCIRGLLCAPCNVGLGAFRDDSDRIIAAAAYLMSRRTEVADA